MAIPVLQTNGFQDVGELLSVRVVAVGLFALVSLLLSSALLALVLFTDDTPAWAFPVGIVVLWRLGLFDWVQDIRTAKALHQSPAAHKVTEISTHLVRRWLSSPLFPAAVANFGATHLHVVVHWAWTKDGLQPVSLVATGSRNTVVSIGLSGDWSTSPIPWNDPSLATLQGRKMDLMEGRWKMDVMSATQLLPVGSAHERLALVSWALSPTPAEERT